MCVCVCVCVCAYVYACMYVCMYIIIDMRKWCCRDKGEKNRGLLYKYSVYMLYWYKSTNTDMRISKQLGDKGEKERGLLSHMPPPHFHLLELL